MVVSTVNRRGGRIILGIDPGTATMGWGVIRQERNRLSYVQHGAIVTPSAWEMPRRLGRLFDGVTELLKGYRPETVAVEEIFFFTNMTNAITGGRGRAGGRVTRSIHGGRRGGGVHPDAGEAGHNLLREGGEATDAGDGEDAPQAAGDPE